MSVEEEEFCLRWKEFHPAVTSLLASLLHSQEFVDVTLTAGGQNIKCHKLVLAACSSYFQRLFRETPCKHPVVILRDISFTSLRAVVEYMYRGEVRLQRAEVEGLLHAAEALQIRGLVDSGPHMEEQTAVSWPPAMGARMDGPMLPCKKRRLTDNSSAATAAGMAAASSRPPAPDGQPASCPPAFCSKGGRSLSPPPPTVPPHPLSGPPLPGPPPPPTDMSDIRPDILEMIKEEQKAKLMELSQNWKSHPPSPSPTPGCSLSYQNQLQSMWQKCWNQSSSPIFPPGVRYRDRGPMKSWRPETMAEAIWSVLNEGLSLSQAARKHDIPYPTFVLYANRVHNMLGPSVLNGLSGDLRPKGRGRPQRILLGQWPEDHVRHVIRSVVFRDSVLSNQVSLQSVTPPLNFGAAKSPSPPSHSLPLESRAAQAALEAQIKSLYSNPFASQLIAASSKMYLDESRFLGGMVKHETPEDTYEDAEEEQANAASAHREDDSEKSIDYIAQKLSSNRQQQQLEYAMTAGRHLTGSDQAAAAAAAAISSWLSGSGGQSAAGTDKEEAAWKTTAPTTASSFDQQQLPRSPCLSPRS